MKYMGILMLGLFVSQAQAGAEGSACIEPRPEMCAQLYQPVCATLKNGSQKGYSNSCSACSDVDVDSWIEGECDG